MNRERNSEIIGGAIILLLPFLLLSNSYGGISASNSYTDNLYFIGDIEKGGNKSEIAPFFGYLGLIDLRYSGNISVIDFNGDDIFFGNSLSIQKKFNLPGLGNKNYIYLEGYNFTPLTYEEYRLNEISAGDSVLVNLGRYLLFAGTQFDYVEFGSDSIADYIKGGLKSYLSFPMLYFYFVPGAVTGLMLYGDEMLSYYIFSLSMDFPLTGDFSFSVSGSYFKLSEPQSDYPISDSLLLDPFFENEGVVRNANFTVSVTKSFMEESYLLNLYLELFKRDFFEIGTIRRNDSGFFVDFRFNRILNNNLSLFVGFNSTINSSTIENLNYTKNSIDGGIQLIF
jgi:hypothetical protein